ncbi:LOW QUALITY PROTEIN: Down syndrome cell adhesion molecule-like protein Dscam2 [Homarus americanus]|uniref:LOW QUALITY PROTEIN: Down syndrome cell adhesion molecule-like protein Dscam2 n=1 Tax=Homarus americanus TaxID=6706 RepID=UPI001C46A2A9|nr:LOW QUALITY PROTEIN: Down syndrome cell adhesion molecule-like protein Dscam2 [Homarus americanus]
MGQYVNVHGQVISHVNISGVRVEDGGSYSCTATNTAASVVHAAPLHVYGRPHVRPMGPMSAVAGETFTVRCPVAGYPISSISWAKSGRTLPINRRQVVSTDGELVITQVTRNADEGDYTCTATNKHGHASSQSLPLRVVEPPQVEPFTLPESLWAGSRVAVQCVAVKGDPPVTLTWLHDGVQATSTPGVTVTPLGQFVLALVIERLRSQHAGNYTCQASSPAAIVSHSATLRVHGNYHAHSCPTIPPSLAVPPSIKPFDFGSLVSGMRTTVTCDVQMGDPPMTLMWLRDGHVLSPSVDLQISQHDTFSSSLVLTHVRPHHAGNYTCVARNEAREVRYTAQLLVRVPPRWVVEPHDVSVIRGKDAILTCHATGFPEPTVTWRKTRPGPGKRVYSGVGMNVGMGVGMGLGVGVPISRTWSNGTLMVGAATEEAEGSYLCEANNGVGAGLSAIINLQVQAPPIVSGDGSVEVRRGESVKLSVRPGATLPFPSPWPRTARPSTRTTTDSKDFKRYEVVKSISQYGRFSQSVVQYSVDVVEGEGVKGGTNTVRAEVRVSNVAPQDSAVIACTATNTYGSHTHHMELKVQDVPEAPRDLRVSREASRSATVTWAAPPSPNTPITHYILHLKSQTATWDGVSVRQLQAEGGSTSVVLNDLLPAKVYQVRVVAVNSVGESPSSEPLTLRTEGEAPSAAPINVQAVGISPRQVQISWSAPDPDTWNGQLLGYYVGHRLDGAVSTGRSFSFDTVGVMGAGEETWTVGGLDRFTRYIFVLQAYNAKGPGPLSTEVSTTTLEDVPEAPPDDVICAALTSTRIQVTWSPPPPALTHGRITTYTLTYTSMDDHTGLPAGESRIVNGQSATVGDLERFTNYSVTVAAATSAGVGVASHPVNCATEEDVPQAPARIKAVVSGPQSVMVTWSAPERPHGTITKYILYIRAPPERDSTRRILLPQTRWLEVTELKPRHRYEFWVSATTRVGEGPASPVVSATPSPTVGAGVYGVGGEVKVPQGTDVVLDCPHVGKPTPTITWRMNNAPITRVSRYEPQPDGGLLLRDCQRSDSANYTCHANNRHGSDHALYTLSIMVPPSAALLHSMGSTPTTVTVSWRPVDDGGAPIRKLTLTWRPDPGEWREVTLARHLTQYTLKELSCGTEYHLYLTSHNRIGPGAASEVITVRTKGTRPTPPPQHRLVSVNVSAVAFHLASWVDVQCAITHYIVRLRPTAQREWQSVSGRLPGTQKEYTVGELIPATTYEVSLTAANPAGDTTATYTFTTLGLTGDHLQEGLGSLGGGMLGSSGGVGASAEDVFTDPAFIVPVVISCIALVSIIIAITLCLRRRPSGGHDGAPGGEDGDPSVTTAAENKSNLAAREQYYATVRKPAPSPIHDVNALERIPEYAEDIYPYATFQIQRQEETLSTHFQTFVYQDPRRATVETLAYRKTGNGNGGGDGRDGRTGRGGSGGVSGGGGGGGGGVTGGTTVVGGGGGGGVGSAVERDSDDYARVKRCRVKYGGESEDYDDSLNSDTDTDHAASSRTESSSHLDDPHHTPISARNHHHNLLYVASDASTVASPLQERKSLPRRSRSRSSGSGNYTALGAANKGVISSSKGGLGGVGMMTTGGMGRSHAHGQSTPAQSCDALEMSETEVDRDNRRRGNNGRRRNTSFSIAV